MPGSHQLGGQRGTTSSKKETNSSTSPTMFVSPFAQTMGLVCQPRQPLLAQLRGTGPAEARRRIGLILSCSTEQHIGSASSAFSPLERRCGTMMSLHGAAAASRIGREVQRRPTPCRYFASSDGNRRSRWHFSRCTCHERFSVVGSRGNKRPSETLRLTPRRNGFVIPHAECWV